MADENENENDEGNEAGQQRPKGSQLRTQLEETLAKNKELEGKLLIHESGLGHLSPRQQRSVLREARDEGKDLTADLLKEVAKDLGYPEVQPNAQQQNGSENEGQQNQGSGNQPDPDDPASIESLSNMEVIELAQRRASNVVVEGSFEHKLANAKSQAEVEAIIRNEGHKVGVIHENDVS